MGERRRGHGCLRWMRESEVGGAVAGTAGLITIVGCGAIH